MRKFDGIANSIDILVGSLEEIVNPDATHLTEFQSRSLCKSCLCPYAYTQQYHVGLERDSRLEVDCQFIPFTGKALNSLFEIELNILLQQMLMHESSHRIVDRSHDLRSHLDHSHLGTSMLEVLCHLKPDEATAHNDSSPHVVSLHIGLDTIGIAHITQGKDTLAVDAFQRRHHRRSTRREQELVVGLDIFLSVSRTHRHLLLRCINGKHLILDTHIDVEPLAECFWSLHEEAVALFYHTANIIRQATIGIRDVFAFFEKDDLCILGQSSDASRCGCSTSHAAHDEVFCIICSHSQKGCFKNIEQSVS